MGRAFAKIAFTPSVKQAQGLYGSRRMNQRLEEADDAQDRLSEVETRFISERDGFYQATVGESGWPYVQFRGGPEGFLQVLDPKTIGFADFRGNVQYLSVGNLGADERVAMILMDYPNRRRLKIWGRARVIHERDDSELLRRLVVPGYPARVERGIVIAVEAFDWNCPQHITPRFTLAQVEASTAPLRERIAELEAQLAKIRPDANGA